MIYTLPAPPEIARTLEELRSTEERITAAREKRRWREWAEAKKAAVPQLLHAAEMIETSWHKMSEENQDQIIAARRALDGWLKSQPEPKNLVERLGRTIKSLWIAAYESDAIPYVYSLTRFMVAVDRALASEARRFEKADEFFAYSDQAQAAMKRGEADAGAGRGRIFSAEEFRDHFTFG